MSLGDYWMTEKELEDFAESAQAMISVLHLMDKEGIEYDMFDVVLFLLRYVECTKPSDSEFATLNFQPRPQD